MAGHYHGWEDNTIAGHSLHTPRPSASCTRPRQREEFKERALYITDELYQCQQADGDGTSWGVPARQADPGGRGGLGRHPGEAGWFDLGTVSAPHYTQHKVMNGLFHVYRTFGSERSLEITVRFADWLNTVVGGLSEVQIQEMLNCEHGGINESLAELYGITGDSLYLGMSRIFHHRASSTPSSRRTLSEARQHADPEACGLARRYELTGDAGDRPRRRISGGWSRATTPMSRGQRQPRVFRGTGPSERPAEQHHRELQCVQIR
ncbi:MAG: glycoside hydrolase family 127 protein [Bacteroidales bacterium]